MNKKKRVKKLKNVSIATLKIKKTPRPVQVARQRKIGRVYGLGLSRFVHRLFEINETLPPSNKMTDGEIARQIREEFSHDANIKERFHVANPNLSTNIYKLRSEYNRGRLTTMLPPPTPDKISFEYDEDGYALNSRLGIATRLSKKEIEERRQYYYENYRKPWEKKYGLETMDSGKRSKSKK